MSTLKLVNFCQSQQFSLPGVDHPFKEMISASIIPTVLIEFADALNIRKKSFFY
jgi:hypothetical protein